MEIEACRDQESMRNLTYEKKKNEVKLMWEWPGISTLVDYAYLFETTCRQESLRELEQRGAKAYSISRKNYIENGCFRKILEKEEVQYKIYPVRVMSSGAVVLDQQSGNVWPPFHKCLAADYSLRVKMKGGRQLLTIEFYNKEIEKRLAEYDVVYHKYNDSDEYLCTYPLNLDMAFHKNHQISIARGEYIRISLKGEMEDAVAFRLRKI